MLPADLLERAVRRLQVRGVCSDISKIRVEQHVGAGQSLEHSLEIQQRHKGAPDRPKTGIIGWKRRSSPKVPDYAEPNHRIMTSFRLARLPSPTQAT